MRLFNLISANKLGYRIFTLIIFLYSTSFLFAQNGNQEAAYIDHKLKQIDSLLDAGSYKQVTEIINTTLNTFSFKKNSEEQLAFDFRKAKNLYLQGNKEKSLKEFLNGLDRLKSKPFSPLNIEYANMLSKIFANSQNFDKAIYYNKIALQKAYLIKDTTSIAKGLIRMGSFYYSKDEEDSAKMYFRKMARFPVTPLTEKRIGDALERL